MPIYRIAEQPIRMSYVSGSDTGAVCESPQVHYREVEIGPEEFLSSWASRDIPTWRNYVEWVNFRIRPGELSSESLHQIPGCSESDLYRAMSMCTWARYRHILLGGAHIPQGPMRDMGQVAPYPRRNDSAKWFDENLVKWWARFKETFGCYSDGFEITGCLTRNKRTGQLMIVCMTPDGPDRRFITETEMGEFLKRGRTE